MHAGDRGRRGHGGHIKRRDRHGRGLRGVIGPPEIPLRRTRAELFDELVLQAVARLEPRWEAELAGIEFAVEEIPPRPVLDEVGRGPVPLARLDPGSGYPPGQGPGGADRDVLVRPDIPAAPGIGGPPAGTGVPATGQRSRPPRIVVYRRPLMARTDSEEDLGELVFDVVVEEFARLLGIDPEDVDPGYGGAG